MALKQQPTPPTPPQTSERIPSPSEIASKAADGALNLSTPPSTPITPPNSPVKFEEGELNQLATLQNKTNQVVNAFGQLKISELRLENQLEKLKNELDSLRKEETDLANTLTKKYGKGTLNAETGEFTPSK
tara:strand:- start:177 stop:569 length:393 start_codon:yes stop_codon:yes gene_type:complete